MANRHGAKAVLIPVFFFSLLISGGCSKRAGVVMDVQTGKPVPQAMIVHDGKSSLSDSSGRFVVSGVKSDKPIFAKAAGYRPAKQEPGRAGRIFVQLQPFKPQGVYVAYDKLAQLERGGLASKLRGLGVNTLVLDIKGDRGLICYDTQVELARQARSKAMPPIEQMEPLLQKLHELGFYIIGRIVVFRDTPLARHKPDWAVADKKTKQPWQDHDGQCWMDPFREEVWDYNVAIASEAAGLGVDEIIFDQVRFVFGGKTQLLYSKETGPQSRKSAVAGFLDRAQRGLLNQNVMISLALNSWSEPTSELKPGDLARTVDCLCPRFLVSGSSNGLVSFDNQLVPQNFAQFMRQEQVEKARIRPWFELPSETNAITAERQTRAALQSRIADGAGMGWLLWNNACNYEPVIRDVRNKTTAKEENGESKN